MLRYMTLRFPWHREGPWENGYAERLIRTLKEEEVKCQRLLGPKFRKVKTSFFSEIRQVSNTLTPNAGVSDDTPVL